MNIRDDGKPGEEWRCSKRDIPDGYQKDVWRVLTASEMEERGYKDGKWVCHVSTTHVNGSTTVHQRFYNCHDVHRNGYFGGEVKFTWERVSNGFQILDEQMEELGLTGSFGLRSQGKFETVQELLNQEKTWKEIGEEIGWSPDAVEQFYNIEK